MRAKDIKVGGVYEAKVNNKGVHVRVDRISTNGMRSGGKERTTYYVTNLSTNRQTTFRSAAKFRKEVKDTAPTPKSLTVQKIPPANSVSGVSNPTSSANAKTLSAQNVQQSPAVVETQSSTEGKQCSDPILSFAASSLEPSDPHVDIVDSPRVSNSSKSTVVMEKNHSAQSVTVQGCPMESQGTSARDVEDKKRPDPSKNVSSSISSPLPVPNSEIGSTEKGISSQPTSQGQKLLNSSVVEDKQSLPPQMGGNTAGLHPAVTAGRKLPGSTSVPSGAPASSIATPNQLAAVPPISVEDLRSKLAARLATPRPAYVAPSRPAHLIVIARAGTGKTWTLTNGLRRLYNLPVEAKPSDQQAAVWEAMLESKNVKHTTQWPSSRGK